MIFHIPRSARTGNLKVVFWNPKLCASLSVEVRLSFWYSTPSGLVMVTMRSPETGFKVESRRRVWTITKVKKSKRPKMKVYTGKEQCRWCVYLSVPLYKQACQFEWELVERKSYSLVCDLQTNEGPGPSSTYTHDVIRHITMTNNSWKIFTTEGRRGCANLTTKSNPVSAPGIWFSLR